MDRRSQQNLNNARTYFNTDLTKDKNDRYRVERIDSDLFSRGMQDGANVNIQVIPAEFKDDFSYVNGFNRAKRIMKAQQDSYELGKQYFFSGRDIGDIPTNYVNNGYFMQGYSDASKESEIVRRNSR